MQCSSTPNSPHGRSQRLEQYRHGHEGVNARQTAAHHTGNHTAHWAVHLQIWTKPCACWTELTRSMHAANGSSLGQPDHRGPGAPAHTFAVRSSEHEASSLPLGSHLMALTSSSCPANVLTGLASPTWKQAHAESHTGNFRRPRRVPFHCLLLRL